MRYILALILAFAAHGAAANCGPTLEIGPEFEIGTSQYGGWEQETTFKIEFVIPVGKNRDVECNEVKAKIAEKKAEAMQERIENLERISRICDRTWIASLCNRLEELGAEIGTQ